MLWEAKTDERASYAAQCAAYACSGQRRYDRTGRDERPYPRNCKGSDARQPAQNSARGRSLNCQVRFEQIQLWSLSLSQTIALNLCLLM